MRLRLPALALLAVTAACGRSGPATVRSPSPTPLTSSSTSLPDDPLSPRPALESPAPRGQATCRGETLTVADADLLASGTALEEVFTVRTTGSPCELIGWPTVSLLDAGDRPIRVTASRVGTPTAETLTTGTSLSFVLSTPRSSSCQDVTTLVVRLPGTGRDVRAPTTMQVCNGTLDVSPVERRQDVEGAEH